MRMPKWMPRPAARSTSPRDAYEAKVERKLIMRCKALFGKHVKQKYLSLADGQIKLIQESFERMPSEESRFLIVDAWERLLEYSSRDGAEVGGMVLGMQEKITKQLQEAADGD